MGIQKPEWFKVDAAKFLSDATIDGMSCLELGACFRLLCRQWIDGSLPDDLRILGRLCRLDEDAMAEAWICLKDFFPPVEQGRRANRFMWLEREKVAADLERRSDEGTRAARKRWDESRKRTALSIAEANGSPIASPNASPSAVPIDSPNGSPMPEAMQDQSRADESRADSQDATGMANPSPKFNSTEIAQILCQQNGWSGRGMVWALQAAIEFQAKRTPEIELADVGERLIQAYSNHKSAKGTFAFGPQKFFEQGLYCTGADRREAKTSVFKDNPATRMLTQMETA